LFVRLDTPTIKLAELVPPITREDIFAMPRLLGFQLQLATDDIEATLVQPGIGLPFANNFTLPLEVSVTRIVFVWRNIAVISPDESAIEVIVGILI
jgi:hypothetical protein